MAQSFEFQAKFGADLSQFNKELNDAAGDVVKLANVFKKFQADASDPIKTEVFVQLDGKDALSGKLGVVSDKFQGLDKDVKALVSRINSLSGAEKGSVTSIKQQISAVQQAINATNKASKDYKTLTTTLKTLKNEYNEVNGVQRGSIAALKQQAAEVERLANAYRIGSREQVQFQRQLDLLNAQIRGGGKPFVGFFEGLDKLARFQAGFTAVTAAIQAITGSLNAFIGQAKQVEGFELALKNIGFSSAQAARALADAGDIANGIGAPIEQVEKSFKRMVPALKAVGTSAGDTNKFIEAVSARTQTLGLNTEQSGRFMEAFAQVLSKGKLQSEELNQQISELDGAFRTQLAEALGKTTEELEDMIKAGQITSPVFVKAFLSMENGAEALRKRVQDGNLTVQQLQNQVRNLNVSNLRTIGAALEPAIKAFFEIQKVFGEFIRDVSQTEFGKFLAESINGIVIGIRNFVIGFTRAAKITIQFLEPVFALARALNDVFKPFGGLIGLLTTYAIAVASVTAAQKLHNVQMMISRKSYAALELLIGKNSIAVKGYTAALKALTAVKAAGGLLKMKKSFKGVTKASYDAAVPLDGIQKLANQMLPKSLGGTATAATGLKGALGGVSASAAGATAATAGVGVAAVAAAAALAAAAAVGSILFANYKYGVDTASALEKGTEGLNLVLKEQGLIVQETAGFWEKLAEALKKTFGGIAGGIMAFGRDIARFFGSQGAMIDAAKRSYGDFQGNVSQLFLKMKQLGVNVYDLESIQQASNKTLEESVKIQEEVAKATEARIKNTEKMIEKAKEEGDLDLKKTLEEQLAKLKEQLPLEKEALSNLQKEIKLRKELARTTGENIESLETLNEYYKLRNQQIANAQTEQEIKLLKQYGNSAAEAGKLAIASIAAEEAARGKKIESLQEEIAAVKKLRDEGKLTEEELEGYAQGQAERQGKLLALQKQRAQSSIKVRDIIIKNFEDELKKGDQLAATYTSIASSLESARSAATSAVSSTLGQISQAIDQVTERELEGLKKGSEERRRLVESQLRAQLEISRLETQIAVTKNNIATRIAQTELRVSQQRLKNEAAIARLRGDEAGAQALEAQAASTQDLIRLKGIENDLNNRALMISQRMKEDRIVQRGIEEKIAGNFKNQYTQLRQTEQSLGAQRLSQQEISNFANQTVRDYESINGVQKKIEGNQRKAVQTSKEGPEKALQSTKDLAKAYVEVDKGARGVFRTMININSESQKLIGNLGKARGLLTGTSARWMGGPVEGGKTYRVNDAGLGREAFMNKFGDIKMLPAGSNINWTAPSSGQIIPAAIVNQMKKNADLNSSIRYKRQNEKPLASGAAVTAQGGNSGNLVKQMTAAMSASGGNQRITNNVTIQSQQPVTDASKIMTNVARMRLRKGSRI